jgi:para-nitrobenzyl esterase
MVMPQPLEVETSAGRVRGRVLSGARAWLGIPFAAPPVAGRRFRKPEPATPWAGVRDATQFGPVAAQDRKGPFAGPPRGVPSSEDCLTLNVLAPATPAGAALPVMVYIHGGAYSVGAPRTVPDRGINFVRHGVVHVTFNYRLNAFGYIDFSEFGFDNNLGLRDQVAALEWVQTNIASFGGDPANVTVYGESSGANAVTTLLATPAAEGLFARAIAQSPPSNAVYWPHDTRKWAREVLELLGVTPGLEAQALRESTTEQLVTAARLHFATVPDAYPGDQAFSPVIDGDFLPRHPMEAFLDGTAHAVPLIIGTNDREGSVFTGRRRILATTRARIDGLLAATSPDAARTLRSIYRVRTHGGALDFGGDFAFFFPAQDIAEAHSRVASTWLYRLDYAPRAMKLLRFDATHGLDLLTVFGRTRTAVGRLITALGGRRAFGEVSERMQRYWLQFVQTGEVDSSWPIYDDELRSSIVFDNQDRVELDSRSDRRLAWDGFVHVHEWSSNPVGPADPAA